MATISETSIQARIVTSRHMLPVIGASVLGATSKRRRRRHA